MENRYGEVLTRYNGQILDLCPAHFASRRILALELKKREHHVSRVLEIGCGEGDSAEPVLEHTDLRLDLADVSETMIERCKSRLVQYRDRINFICGDGITVLQQNKPYDIIIMEWVLHNFPWEEKRVLLRSIYQKLTPGGQLFLMDKIYPDEGAQELFEVQMKRYAYLPSEAQEAIVDHETQDFLPEYRMDEKATFKELAQVGFKNVRIVDRLEREVVLVAEKVNLDSH